MKNLIQKIDELILILDPVKDGLLIGMLSFKKNEFNKKPIVGRHVSVYDFQNARKGLGRHLTNEMVVKNTRLSQLNDIAEMEAEEYFANNKKDEYYKLENTKHDEYGLEKKIIENKIYDVLYSGEYDHAIELKALINNINKKLTKILKS